MNPPSPSSPQFDSELENKISPSILLIIVILAVIFFISGLLHLLVRYLLRPVARDPDDGGSDSVTALQGQLQQLFHLHDSGVDQAFIDALPVFLYRAIVVGGAAKDPFDCAVCLCEFEPHDKLRLLPKCSHAFHIECIDTWLLSHSTCPLCRGSLLPSDFSPASACSPVVLVLESGTDSALGSSRRCDFDDPTRLQDNDGDCASSTAVDGSDDKPGESAKVVQVKLGKFRSADPSVGGGEGSSAGNGNLDQRRCFSMGSYEYVMNEASVLQVAIKPTTKKPSRMKKPGYAMSECDCHSKREGFRGYDSTGKALQQGRDDCGSARITGGGGAKRESFSISKIWLRSNNKDKAESENSSRRAFSFRLPLYYRPPVHDSMKPKSAGSPRPASEFDTDLDVEVGSCNNSAVSMSSRLDETPSFARRTLMWIVGRQNRVGSHS